MNSKSFTPLKAPTVPKPTPPERLNPAAFLKKATMSKDSQGVYSSASTLRDELETLDSAKTRLVRQFGSISTQPIARHRTLNSQNPMTRSNSISERIGALSIKDINEDPVCRKKSYRNDASLDAKESERALKYMERYNKCKSGKRRETALKHEWNSSTNLSSSNLAHRIPAMTRSSKTPLSTSQSTLVMNPEESTERLTSHSSSVSSNDESETRIEHEPLQSDQLNGLGNRAFSFVDIKQAPSLTSLSKIQPDHATLAASVHVTVSCKGCGAVIPATESSLSAMGFVWHPNCFKCANTQCDRPIGQSNFYQRGKYSYCENCWVGNVCAKCDECGLPVEDRRTQTLVQGHVYHKACFICSHCKNPLLPMTQFVEPKGIRFCLPCYQQVHGKKCKGCGDLCQADFVAFGENETYHRVCITCKVCYRSLEDCGEFYRQKDGFYCSEHRTVYSEK